MGFWLFMLATNLLVPVIMIGIGWYFLKKPPKKINPLFGYRTTRSMKNVDTWAFAHRTCGKIWVRWGWAVLVVSVIPMLAVLGKDENTIGWVSTAICLLQLIPLLGSIVPVELALKKTFDESGNRRQKLPE